MNAIRLAVFAMFLVPVIVIADDVEKEVEMKVVVAGDDHETIEWDIDSTDFEMSDLAVGESRVIENDSGRTITLTRTDSGMQVDVDGKTVEIPDISAHAVMLDASDIDVEMIGHEVAGDVAVAVAGTHAIRAHPPEGVTILSATPLDDSVRESIRSVLISAGIDEEVRFVDGSEKRHEVRVIKRVETL